MLSFRRWLDRKLDRRPVIRISRTSYRRRAWWRSARAGLLVGLLLAAFAAIAVLLARHSPAQAEPSVLPAALMRTFIAASDEQPASP